MALPAVALTAHSASAIPADGIGCMEVQRDYSDNYNKGLYYYNNGNSYNAAYYFSQAEYYENIANEMGCA